MARLSLSLLICCTVGGPQVQSSHNTATLPDAALHISDHVTPPITHTDCDSALSSTMITAGLIRLSAALLWIVGTVHYDADD